MLTAIRHMMKKIGIFYKKFLKADIQKNRYGRITKMFVAVMKYILFKKPALLMVETGTICNLNCPTCPTPREIVVGSRPAKNMEFDTFKKIIDNAYKSFSGITLYWSNEPLLNKNIARMVRYCNELNLYTFISTNGMLLTDSIFKELINAGLDELLVCVDGFSPETYERFRRGGKLDTVKKNIETICNIKKELKAASPWIEIQYVETKQNSKEIASCMKWSQESGVDGFRVVKLAITQHLHDAERLREEFYTEKRWEQRYKETHQAGKRLCTLPDWQASVLVNGQLTICCMDIRGDCSYGNLLENSFKSITADNRYSELKKKSRKRELSICQKC